MMRHCILLALAIIASSSCSREDDAADAMMAPELAPQSRRVPRSIVVQTKFVEISSGTEDLGFDWLLESSASIPKMAEQAGTEQPATRPLSKSEGSDNPQPESEGRSK
jgi:hypothetical protein